MHTETFLTEFARLTCGPGGVQKLRELVLQLALSGRLTGGLDAAANWRMFHIYEVADCFTGNSISVAEKSQKYQGLKEGLPYIATKDVNGWHGGINYESGVRIPYHQPRFKVAPNGSVLICAEGGSAGRKIGVLEKDVNFGNKLICCVPNSGIILQKYLFRVFQSRDFQESFKNEMTGIIGGISLSKFKSRQICLPELPLQEKIVAKVNELMALCDELEAQQIEESRVKRATAASALHRLTETQTSEGTADRWLQIFEDFGELFDDSENVQKLRSAILECAYLGAFCDEVPRYVNLEEVLSFGPRNGFSPKPAANETETRSITLSAITQGKFDQSKFKYINEVIDGDSHLFLKEGDLLIQRSNSLDYVGVSAIVRNVSGRYIYPDLIMKMQVCDEFLSEYILYCLQSPSLRNYFRDNASGTSGSMPKINQKVVNSALVPVVSLDAQNATVKAVRKLVDLCDRLEEQVREGERLNAELMASLVHALTETDPDGGGAVALVGFAENAPTVASEQANKNAPKAPGAKSARNASKPKPEIRATPDRTPFVDTKFQEAVLVTAIVKTFFQAGGEPIGNFRLQKAVYFARRKMGEHVGEMAYLKKAAGPYNPSMKYSGGIAIAKQKNWLRETRGRFGFGHVPGPAAEEMEDWFAKYGFRDPARWVAEHFRFKRNEEWETLATVDYAMEHLQSLGVEADATQILQYIRADDEWRPKIEKLRLTEMSVGTAMLEVKALFSAVGGDDSV